MPANVYRMTIIFLFCFFATGCPIKPDKCASSSIDNKQPYWARSQIAAPNCGGGSVGCSQNINTFNQTKEANAQALHEFAMRKGIEIESILRMEVKEEAGSIHSQINAEIQTNQGTHVTIKADTYDKWISRSGNKTCVWLKEIN